MRCPNCHSLETETNGVLDVIDSDAEGELVTMDAYCLKCGFRFSFDDFVPRPEKETVQ
jgi:C4-type Zn-finger protein